MKPVSGARQTQGGFTLVEVLVTMIILLIGLLGLVGLMVTSQRSQVESYQRVQALVVAQDMADRINANRHVASCYVLTAASPYLGTGVATPTLPTCTLTTASAEQKARAIEDMNAWHKLLLGAAEMTTGAKEAGAMLGARGCIELTPAGVYQVSVAWQGNGKTAAPAASVTCASGLYGDETQRRVITLPVKVANLVTGSAP